MLALTAERSSVKRAQLRTLCDTGLSAPAIARELSVSKPTVSHWAKLDGVSFNRSKTAEAVAAKLIDLAAGRQRLTEAMLTNLGEPCMGYNIGGKDSTYSEHKLDSAPVEVRRNAITMAGITFDKLTLIVCTASERA